MLSLCGGEQCLLQFSAGQGGPDFRCSLCGFASRGGA